MMQLEKGRQLIESLFNSLAPYVLGALGLVAGWFLAERRGKKKAEQKQEAEALKDQVKAMEIVRDVHEKYESMSDDDVRQRAIERMQRNAAKK